MSVFKPDISTFLLEGENFSANEHLIILSQNSKTSIIEYEVEVDNNGKLTMLIYPSIPGKKGGKAYLDVIRKGSKEKKTIVYFWGKEAAKTKNSAFVDS